MVVVDTDILIDAGQAGPGPAATSVSELARAGDLVVSAITVYELLQGSRTSIERLERAHAFLASASILDLNRDSAEMAAAVSRYLERRGERIGAPDILIAGSCLDAGLPLLTRNARHFERVPGLEVLSLE
jgi:tRNA(fMet)-specific endonuclease VapC